MRPNIGPMTIRIASCSCGALTARCAGDPVRVSVCHCLACQRRSGSAFAVQARFPEDRVTIAGASRNWTRIGDEGSQARFRFCPVCGSTLFYTVDEDPGLIAIAVGAFADPDFPPPTRSVYEVRRHRWTSISGDDVEHWD